MKKIETAKNILDLRSENFGYAHPERVILSIFIGEPYLEKYAAFKKILNRAEIALQGKNKIICPYGREYPLTTEGMLDMQQDIYGSNHTIKIDSESVEWETDMVQIAGSKSKNWELLPICEVDGKKYALTNPTKHYKTPSGRQYGEKPMPTNGYISIPYYIETFRAGHACAGIDGNFYIPKGVVDVSKCLNS